MWSGSAGGGAAAAPVTTARYWRLVGRRGVTGHVVDGFGLCLLNFRAAGVALIPVNGAGGFSSVPASGGFNLAAAFNGSSAANNGWYSGNGEGAFYTQPHIGYDFGAAVKPNTVEFAPITSNAWTSGESVILESSVDKVVWRTVEILSVAAGADGVVQSFAIS